MILRLGVVWCGQIDSMALGGEDTMLMMLLKQQSVEAQGGLRESSTVAALELLLDLE